MTDRKGKQGLKKTQFECFTPQKIHSEPWGNILPSQTASSDLKHTILTRLEEIYTRALEDKSYPSALRSLELTLKMLSLKDFSPLIPSVDELTPAAIQDLIKGLKGQ